MRPRTPLLCLVVALATPVLASQLPQTPPPTPVPTGAISGVVVDGATKAPMAEVIVSLAGGIFPAGYQTRQLTDAKGRFVFMNLPDSDAFQLTTSKFGFLDGGYGRDTAPSDALRPIVVRSGAPVGNLRVPIWKPSAISGAVRDESGEPVVGVFVRALARIRIAGRDELAAGPMTVTDDRGLYRLSGLVPGRYIIQVPSVQMAVPGSTPVGAASTDVPAGAIDVDDGARLVIGRYPLPPPPVNGRATAYGIAFHPVGSLLAQAAVIDIKFGDDRTDVDIALSPVPAVRVSGMVEGPSDALVNLTLRLLPAGLEGLGNGAEVATALVAADGSFTFLNVPAGTYTLDAPVRFNEFTMTTGSSGGSSVGFGRTTGFPSPPPRSGWSRTGNSIESVPGVSLTSSEFRGGTAPNYSGRTSVTVGGADLTGVTVRLRPMGTMRGRVVMEPDPAKAGVPLPQRVSFTLDPAGGQPGLGMPTGSALLATATEFEITGIQPGEYWLRGTAFPGAWLIKSIQWRGRDYTQTPFDAASAEELRDVTVTMTNAAPVLSGTVRAQDGSAPDSGIVVAFPTVAGLRVKAGLSPTRMKSATLQSNGAFRLMTLPAGEYFVAAIDRSRMATWRDPEFLALLERSATRVTLAWGQTVSQNLTMAVVR